MTERDDEEICPRCGDVMRNDDCKLRCLRCGYFEDCSSGGKA